MDKKNRPQDHEKEQTEQNRSSDKAINPFENKQPVEKDIAQSREELENEQAVKEASTERD